MAGWRRGRRSAWAAGLAMVLLLTGCSSSSVATHQAEGAQPFLGSDRGASRSDVPARSSAGEKPNVVVVMTDDMRADDLQYMPRTRRLVGRTGVDMRNAFSQFPLCCPARASFLSGQTAHNHGVLWHVAPFGYGAFDDSRTLATSLQGAGYRTGFIGKYLNGYGPATSEVSGEPSYGYVPRGWTEWRAAIENPGVEGITGDTYDYFKTPYNVDGEVRQDWHGRYQTSVVGDFSVGMASRFAGDQPFFMYVSYVAPHFGQPVEMRDWGRVTGDDGRRRLIRTPAVPESLHGRFDDRIPQAAGMPADGGPAEADVSDKGWFWSQLPEPSASERLALRDSTRQRAESLLVVDRQVERLVTRLKKLGEWDDTVLVFTSDNGYFQGEHRQRDGKIKAHEPSLRIPLLITGPGVPQGEQRYDPITMTDLTATLLDIGAARPPRRPDGVSRWDSISDGDRGWSAPVLTEARHSTGNGARVDPSTLGPPLRGFTDGRSSIGIRTARYSYTRWRYGFTELYDLVRDPLQLRNLAGTPRVADDERRLERLWWRLKDCRGRACTSRLPDALATDADTVERWGRAYWQEIRRTYG